MPAGSLKERFRQCLEEFRIRAQAAPWQRRANAQTTAAQNSTIVKYITSVYGQIFKAAAKEPVPALKNKA